jgi:hypothetical protein
VGTRKAGLHGPEGAAKRFRNFLVGKILEVAQYNNCPQLRREPLDHGVDVACEFAVFGGGARELRDLIGGNHRGPLGAMAFVEKLIERGIIPKRRTPAEINARVHRNAINPAGKFRLETKVANLSVKNRESFLRRIERVGWVACNPVRHVIDTIFEELKKLGESFVELLSSSLLTASDEF